LKTRCARTHWNFLPNASVFSNALSNHGAEQFRTLRSRLYQMRSSRPLRTLLVTSALPDEGKTFVASNLAQAFIRQEDRSVLIIDADLRRAHLHIPLGAPLTPGLTDYLSGKADEFAVIQHGGSGNLCFIPAGTLAPNPSELLMNGRLKTLLERVATAFTWVIIDSPPCLLVSDASILADACDGVLLVVQAASTPAAVAQRARQEMQGRHIVGVVLNSAEPSGSYGSSYYGYSYK
jgi:capsular exopolysaccharide synthesis family protein